MIFYFLVPAIARATADAIADVERARASDRERARLAAMDEMARSLELDKLPPSDEEDRSVKILHN